MEQEQNQTTTLSGFMFNEDKEIRVHIDENNQPWFVVRDIAQALELNDDRGTSTLVERIPEDFQDYLTLGNIADVQGRVRDTYMIAEPGMYYLVLTSRAANAFPMCRWVCEDVLPEIRKSGQYTVVGSEEKIPENFKELQKTIHKLHQDLAEGLYEVAHRSRQEFKDLRLTIANTDKTLIEGIEAVQKTIHQNAIPITRPKSVRKKSGDDYFTQDEFNYYKFLNIELINKMHLGGKAQVSGHVNTTWRRKFGYKVEASSERGTAGMTLFHIVAKEHYLDLKMPDTEFCKRLGWRAEQRRPHQNCLLKLMEDELSMETGDEYSITKFLGTEESTEEQLTTAIAE